MDYFHLLRKKLFQPLIFANIVLDKLDGQLPTDFYGTLAFLLSVEPSFSPPHDTIFVGIDTDDALNVETLYVNIEILKWIDDSLTCYGVVSSFFFSYSVIVERNTPCIRAR